jgi:hypothetical protein
MVPTSSTPPIPNISHPSLAKFLASLALAPRQAHKALTLWPLLAPSRVAAPRAPAYVPLVEALDADDVVIDEVSESGSVPHVRVTNRGERAVLVLFGEELRGAMQNRVANASFLIAAKSETVIDVSCVEQGRWSRRPGARFEAGMGVVSNAMRRGMQSRVARARAAGDGFRADQSEVWRDVEERMAFARAYSETAAYSDYVETRRGPVDALGEAFRAVPNQVGFVASIAGEVAGLEAVGRPDVFARVFRRLLGGYAIDAVDADFVRARSLQEPAARFESPERFLDALRSAHVRSAPSLALGSDLRMEGIGVEGCALEAGELVHLSAFAA